MSKNANLIKNKLEEMYDIPFTVEEGSEFNDPWFDIRPTGSNKELFDIHVEFINQIRIIIEIQPEEYAAFSILDMARANKEKKKLFSRYAELFLRKKAKVDFYINESKEDPTDNSHWPEEWNNYRCRISKSPVVCEEEELDFADTVADWAGMAAGMFLSLLNVIQIEENQDIELTPEGGQSKMLVNKYERNPINRELCLSANGYTCKICGFDFEKFYGHIGEHFIHVHHIIPVSEMGHEYMIDPVNDMIPVCPNCHNMLHRCKPVLLPDELKDMIKSAHKE